MAEPVNVEESETPSRKIATTKTSSLIQEFEETKERYIQLEAKYDNYMKEMKLCLFRLERLLSSDIHFRFYTRFPDYTTFKAFFNYLSPECRHLNYYGSATAQIASDVQKNMAKQDLCHLKRS